MTANGTEHRKLAAIMFTDMVGYTALSQRNEALALELLEEHRTLLRSLFPRFGGSEIKTIGDAFLVEFESALEAARCAIEIQRTLAQRNLSAPAERQVQVRIGIHVGDIVHRQGDVLGDGVNIASRIEPLAEPGGICISVDVAHQIQHNLETAVVRVGQAELKNVQVPLEICRIVLPWERPGSALSEGKDATSRRLAPKAIIATLTLLVAIGALAWWFARPRPSTPPTRPGAGAPRMGTALTEKKSVAVLPFANLGPDKADEYLSDGLTEELISLLVRVRGLRVPARTSSFVFKDRKEDIRKIGELLNVQTVLEGSVRKSGNRIRVTAQLINVTDGFHLWSETYDRDVGDLLTMQEEIARKITDKLRMELTDQAREQLAKRSTHNSDAHELYLKGLYWSGKRTKDGLQKAIQLFSEAQEKDPQSAAACAALSASHSLCFEYAGRPAGECLPQAKAAALRALELDPALAEAHAAMGLALTYLWDWEGAEAAFKQAVALNPDYATGHHWYSRHLRVQGRLAEATAEILHARELDPLSPIIAVNLGQCFQYAGEHDRAISQLRSAFEINPDFVVLHRRLGDAYLAKGMLPEALAELQKTRSLIGESPYGLGMLGYLLARSGRQAEALATLASLEQLGQKQYAVHVETAIVYLGLGDKERTFAWLNEACRDHEQLLMDLKTDPYWKELRPDPQFQELLKKINLTP